MPRRSTVLAFLLAFLAAVADAPAQEPAPPETQVAEWVRASTTTADFEAVCDQVSEFAERHTPELVLLVVDIDNTLLAMNQDLGSDQWFNWQAGLLEEQPNSPDLVAPDFEGLLRVQNDLFTLSGMHPPQPELPRLIRDMQRLGVATVILTSRSPNFRDAAERELVANGYDFTSTAPVIDERRGDFMPFDPRLPDAHGLSAEIIRGVEANLRPVSYAKGVYMTAGQHKGYMLRSLLSRMVPDYASRHEARIFRAIVFVDDHSKHTTRMHDAFEGVNLDLATFRFSREDGNVEAFNASTKRHVVDDWNRMRRAFDAVLVR